MFDVEIKVTNPNLLDAYAYVVEQVPDIIYQTITQDVSTAEPEIMSQLRTEPGPVVYAGIGAQGQPVLRWKSEKQRKAFFATNGFGHGIPYKRTHEFVRSWRMRIDYSNPIIGISIGNDTPARQFITGQYQQPFHQDTGWPLEEEAFAKAQEVLDDRLETALIRVLYVMDALAEVRATNA